MFGWMYVVVDRYGRSDSRTMARRLSWLPGGVIRGVQRAKLAWTLRYVWRRSPVQRKRWEAAGVRRRDLGKPAVLERIPYLDAEDLARHGEDYRCVPMEKMTHVISTSGTSGTVKKLFFTTEDMDRQARMIGTKLRRLPGASRVLAMYSVDHTTWASGPMARRGIEKAGMFGLLVGVHKDPQEMFDVIREYKIDTLMGVTSWMHRMTEEAKVDPRELGVKYLLLGGQAWSEELRRELEEAWGATAIDVYGTNECACGIAAECEHKNGLHISEADFWVEVLDPKTGKGVPDGVEGEVVVTTLSREGMPLVRYRTKDLAHILPDGGRCACGMAVRKMSRVRGRLDDVVILSSNNVYPDEFERAVMGVEGVTDYQVAVDQEGHLEVLSLTVEAERETPELVGALRKALLSIENVHAGVESMKTAKLGRIQVVKRGALSAGRPKAVRIVDRRG